MAKLNSMAPGLLASLISCERRLWSSFLLAVLLTTPCLAEMPSFPGATGYGKLANGWRGGNVVYVTNLEDNGPGSLRSCAEGGAEPRVCVFAISGTIEVDTPIMIGANTYLAGQTAPGNGIQIRLGKSQTTPMVIKNAHDVLIRFLKLRPGASSQPSANVDGITIEDSEDVYLDHLSIQFATDENVNVHANKRPTRNITVARSIVAWGLERSNHPKGKHSKGALICSDESGTADCGRISLVQNLFAHNQDRNPDLKGTDTGPIEVINNVFYNPRSQFGEFYNLIGNTRIAYIGNVALAGPTTVKSPPLASIQAFAMHPEFALEIYVDDNLNVIRDGCKDWRKVDVLDATSRPFVVEQSPPVSTERIMAAADTYEFVMSTAGARKAASGLIDELDRRLLGEVRKCKGKVVDTAEQAGGWPEIEITNGPPDSDRDGMPDFWEVEKGLDPQNANDTWSDRDGDGWSNLEEYLNSLAY